MSKHLPVLLIILFSSFLVFSGCQESVQLTTQPSGAISQMQAIPFEFSVDLAPKDQLNKWTESSFVRFTPPLSGKFIWETPRLLKFTPDMPLEPARHYSAVIQKAVLFGKKKRTDFDTLKFNTQLIEVEGVSATWSEYSSYGMKAPIELTLVFNQEIVVRELKNYLKVYCNGEEVTDLNIYGYGTDKEVRIYLEGKDNAGETQQFQLQLKAGLPSQYEYATLEKPAELTTLLHPVAEVKIQTINVEIRDGHQLLVMETNQKISPKILRSYLKVSPETPIQIENYGNKMHIKGAFKPGSLVNVSIRKGLHGLNGGELKEDFSYNLTLPDLEPFLRFTDQKGYYLMRNGFENLNVKCVNIKSFEVRLYEIYENNLSHFISENSDQFIRTDYSYDYGVDIDNYGRLMFLDSIHLPNVEKNTLQNRTINLQKQLRSKYKGLYAIELRHNSDRWERISKVVSLSDIGLISKQSPDEIIVYANALSSARPLAGARVQLRSVTNQVLATATTNGQGIARFQHLKEKLQSGPDGWVPSLITAHYGDDFNYISFRHSEVYNGRWENDGKEKKQIDAFLYPDRDLFRPGDTAHFAAILRNWDLSTPPDLPVRFQILGPSGDLVLDLKKTTNSQGSFEVQVPLSSGATTGRYRAQVLSTSKELLNSISFNIETFVPDKIKVSLGSDSKDAGPGDTLLFPLAASYYFGADCSSHSYEYRIRFQNQSFYSLNYPRFNFQ
ncbi:MAG TPA: hypothetical protein ENJ82_12475, partial [Bacteroidetes bacterium]|nr:hypothetical protein [Bacteroidota bacterium]